MVPRRRSASRHVGGRPSGGLTRLVSPLIGLVEEMLERPAQRSGGFAPNSEDVERLRVAFLRLSEEVARMRKQFGLEPDAFELDLEPMVMLR
jgi:hypothetical protein